MLFLNIVIYCFILDKLPLAGGRLGRDAADHGDVQRRCARGHEHDAAGARKGATALMGSLRISCFLTQGLLGYSRLPTFIFPKVPGRTFFPNLSEFITSAAAPLVLTPFVRNQFKLMMIILLIDNDNNIHHAIMNYTNNNNDNMLLTHATIIVLSCILLYDQTIILRVLLSLLSLLSLSYYYTIIAIINNMLLLYCYYAIMLLCLSIIYIYIYTHTYIHTYMHACMHAYMHACMHACIHT